MHGACVEEVGGLSDMTPNLSIGAPVEVTMGHGAKVVGKIISRDPIVVEYEAPEGTQRKEADWSYMRPDAAGIDALFSGEETMKPGDLVRLKSGGPVMTVGADFVEGRKCSWFSGDTLQGATLPEEMLEPAEHPRESDALMRARAIAEDSLSALRDLKRFAEERKQEDKTFGTLGKFVEGLLSSLERQR